ncbi:MAG: hypothetical protein JXL80_13990 [Planctomycetes bacterium]|nr:hypothetical protein [Planctomycetota bacterium]
MRQALVGWTVILCLCAVAVRADDPPAATTDAADGAATATSGGETAPLTVDQLKGMLLEEVAKGKLSDEAVALYLRYADALAFATYVPETVDQDFWTWVRGVKPLHEALLVELESQYGAAVLKNLAHLHSLHGEKLNTRWPLAMAFSVVYARSGGRTMSAGWSRRKNHSNTPSMDESFSYYINFEQAMHGSYTDVPWQMLCFVADNDLPTTERMWVLENYSKLHPTKYERLYYYVDYKMSVTRRGGALIESEYRLEDILAIGGVCCDRAYFASRVLKSLAIPSAYDCGLGESQVGHAWLMWLQMPGKGHPEPRIRFSGRFDDSDYYTGEIRCPLACDDVLDRKLELKTQGLFNTYRSYVTALVACRIFEWLEGDQKAMGLPLLEQATAANPGCAEPWWTMARGVADGTLTKGQGEQMVESMMKAMKKYPDMTFEVLAMIFEPRIAAAGEAATEDAKRDLAILDRAFAFYETAGRPDLAARLRFMQGRYAEALGRDKAALDLYIANSQKYVKVHYGLLDLFNRAMAMMADEKFAKARLKYLDFMARNVPRYPTAFNRQFEIPSSSYRQILNAYIAELRNLGSNQEADTWQAKLDG